MKTVIFQSIVPRKSWKSGKKRNRVRNRVEKEKNRPVIDKIYHIEEIVDAHRYIEQGHKKGNVVIQMER
jgi:NADPH:quinone reductase-like Zn-dependent oxidoreductase